MFPPQIKSKIQQGIRWPWHCTDVDQWHGADPDGLDLSERRELLGEHLALGPQRQVPHEHRPEQIALVVDRSRRADWIGSPT